MPDRTGRRRRLLGACLLAFGLCACSAAVPAARPSPVRAGATGLSAPSPQPGATGASAPSGVPGPISPSSPTATAIPAGSVAGWSQAAIELPPSVTDMVAGQQANVHCSPCHAAQADLLFGVGRSGEGFVALGAQEPPSAAVAWRSSDGRSWSPIPGLPETPGSIAMAVASLGARTVIVGGDATGATSWASTDLTTWRTALDAADRAGASGSARMTALTTWRGEFVAGGYQDDPAHNRWVAAIWISPDGLDWRRVSAGPAFENGRIFGIAARGDTLVAVGTTANLYGAPAVVWATHDGAHWSRVASSSFQHGAMRAVVAGGPGFVAVGFGADDDRAAVWTSADGLSWQAVPDQPALENAGRPIRMAAVAADGGGVVAVGWISDPANGSGAAWRSPDGTTWTRDPDQVTLAGGELAGIAVGPLGLIGVGTSGYPDNDQASVWLSRP